MLISPKQLFANRQNARHSTGPKTPEGKAAVRLNALTYGLRARQLLLDEEDPAEYQQLWDDLIAEWQPQGCTEHLQLEQMATSQWLLARNAKSERRIYEAYDDVEIGKRLSLLDRASAQRARLERSFATALNCLKQLQKERQAQSGQTAAAQKAAAQPVTSQEVPAPPPPYVMGESPAGPGLSCAAPPDSR